MTVSGWCLVLSAALCPTSGQAQTLDDGLMLRPRQLRVGMDYVNESWREYWEGGLRRSNENIGTLTTQSTVLSLGYGMHKRVAISLVRRQCQFRIDVLGHQPHGVQPR